MDRRSGCGGGRESIKAFSELAPSVVKNLKKRGLKTITTGILKACLQSAAFAGDTYGMVAQESWAGLLDIMVAEARDRKLDPAVLENWKATRDTTEITMPDEVDFEGLEDFIKE